MACSNDPNLSFNHMIACLNISDGVGYVCFAGGFFAFFSSLATDGVFEEDELLSK